MNVNELLGFLEVFRKAEVHHDPTNPVVYDTTNLAKDGAAVAPKGGIFALLEFLLANPAIVAVVVAFLKQVLAGRPLNPPTQPVLVPTPPVPTGPVVTNTPAPHPTLPSAAVSATKEIASLEVNLDLFLAEGVPAPYKVEEHDDYYQIVKTDGTDNLPIHGGAYLHAGYINAQGKGIMFDPGSPLDHTAVWTAKRVGGGETVWVGPGNPAQDKGDRSVANFRVAEYERTRGMDVPVHFPPTANETEVEITLSVGSLKAKAIRFPKIS